MGMFTVRGWDDGEVVDDLCVGGVREQPAPNLDTPVRHTARYLGTEGPGWFCQKPGSNNNPGECVGAA